MQNQPQVEVFSGVIDVNLEFQVQNFINDTKQNPAKLQQLAIDASHLLSNSEDRLVQQQNTGFFKRIVGAFTGKPNEIARQNQSDIIEMQKFAWCYLKELQRQNLIAGKSIAVIRNNLVTMNDAIIETREFLEEAIDKINSRLTKVESKTELQDWGVAKEAEKRKFKIVPETIKTLLLTFDFIKSNYKFINNYSDMNYIFVSLDKFGVDLDEKISLNEFIYQLVDEIEVWGDHHKYNALIALDLEDVTLDTIYIHQNISGAGINALYYLSNNYSKIRDILLEIEDDEIKKRVVAKFFGDDFGHLSETYTIEELVIEIIGGCLTAIDLYNEQNQLVEYHSDANQDKLLQAIDFDAMQSKSSAHNTNQIDLLNELGFFGETQSEIEFKTTDTINPSAVPVSINGTEKKLTIKWTTDLDYPFDVDRINSIASNGEYWVVCDERRDRLYKSKDGLNWSRVNTSLWNASLLGSMSEVRYVDGVWLVFSLFGEFIFSDNLLDWKKGALPNILSQEFRSDYDRMRNDGNTNYLKTNDFFKFGDQWLWRIDKTCDFKYIEKGMIWDSEKITRLESSVFYSTDALDSPWQEWADAPKLDDGIKVKKIAKIPQANTLIIFAECDHFFFRSVKNKNPEPDFAMSYDGYQWASTNWTEVMPSVSDDSYFKTKNGEYFYYGYNGIYRSSDGKQWEKTPVSLNLTEGCELGSISIFTAGRRLFSINLSSIIYFSTDLKSYQGLEILKSREVDFLVLNGNKILSISEVLGHKVMKIGEIILD